MGSKHLPGKLVYKIKQEPKQKVISSKKVTIDGKVTIEQIVVYIWEVTEIREVTIPEGSIKPFIEYDILDLHPNCRSSLSYGPNPNAIVHM